MGAQCCSYKKTKRRSALMIGLDNAGKTTLLFHLKKSSFPNRRFTTIPTAGSQVVEFKRNFVRWKVFDLGGQGRYRSSWLYYTSLVHALVYVIDISDVTRLLTSKIELWKVLNSKIVRERRIPVLILVNKTDLESLDDNQDEEMEEMFDSDDEDKKKERKKKKKLKKLMEVEGETTEHVDLPPITLDMIHQIFDLDELEKRHQTYKMMFTSGADGNGIEAAFFWLSSIAR